MTTTQKAAVNQTVLNAEISNGQSDPATALFEQGYSDGANLGGRAALDQSFDAPGQMNRMVQNKVDEGMSPYLAQSYSRGLQKGFSQGTSQPAQYNSNYARLTQGQGQNSSIFDGDGETSSANLGNLELPIESDLSSDDDLSQLLDDPQNVSEQKFVAIAQKLLSDAQSGNLSGVANFINQVQDPGLNEALRSTVFGNLGSDPQEITDQAEQAFAAGKIGDEVAEALTGSTGSTGSMGSTGSTGTTSLQETQPSDTTPSAGSTGSTSTSGSTGTVTTGSTSSSPIMQELVAIEALLQAITASVSGEDQSAGAADETEAPTTSNDEGVPSTSSSDETSGSESTPSTTGASTSSTANIGTSGSTNTQVPVAPVATVTDPNIQGDYSKAVGLADEAYVQYEAAKNDPNANQQDVQGLADTAFAKMSRAYDLGAHAGVSYQQFQSDMTSGIPSAIDAAKQQQIMLGSGAPLDYSTLDSQSVQDDLGDYLSNQTNLGTFTLDQVNQGADGTQNDGGNFGSQKFMPIARAAVQFDQGRNPFVINTQLSPVTAIPGEETSSASVQDGAMEFDDV